MKKSFLIFFLLMISLLLLSNTAKADLVTGYCNESSPPLGLVPCGNTINADGGLACPCQLGHIFTLAQNIYNFLIFYIATPLAGLLIVIGGVLLLLSAGNPNLAATARKILWGTLIGIFLVFGAWLIINVVLMAIGYQGSWYNF